MLTDEYLVERRGAGRRGAWTWLDKWEKEGGAHSMRSRSLETIDPRIPALPGRISSGFH